MSRAHHEEHRLQILRLGRQAMAQSLEEVLICVEPLPPDDCPVTALSGSFGNGQAERAIGGNLRELVFKAGS
jgi:hypothetical protein